MQFNRPPRLQTPRPADIVRIPNAPEIPSKPDKTNWLVVLLPVGMMLISVVIMVSLSRGNQSSLSYLMFLPIMIGSSIAGIFMNSGQKKKYETAVSESRKKFRESLRGVESDLARLQKTERRLRIGNDPEPAQCVLRAQNVDPRLCERRPKDGDFLFLRMGLGEDIATFTIDEQYREDKKEEFAEEYRFIEDLAELYRNIEDIPVQARLSVVGSLGIGGEREEVLSLTRVLLTNVLCHHWPDEVNVIAVSTPGTAEEWRWIKDTPHLSSIQSHGWEERSLVAQLNALEHELQMREQQIEALKLLRRDGSGAQDIEAPLPRLVVIFDYLPSELSHPALDIIAAKGKELGVHAIHLTTAGDRVPGSAGAVISFGRKGGRYFETGPLGYNLTFRPDEMTREQAERFAQALRLIDWPSQSDASQPPEIITFLEMFGYKRADDLPIETWWEERNPYGYLKTPIGAMSASSKLIFDLNDGDGSHGPHGLLGGMTGSGKSEALKAIILSLAVTHHPYDLNFALIDFKGGAAFNELADLPHTVGIVTDIESNATYAERVIQALGGEIERRKRVLEQARSVFNFSRPHIDDYRKLSVRRPLPRLVIVFDEFAEFKQRNPVESKKLISIARQGRSLGVHLILATQNIQAAVDPEILQNSTFKICLRVADPQDSMQMVGIPDAINLTRGRAYFDADRRILFQSAFSGAAYYEEGMSEPESYVRIWKDGRREKLPIQRPRRQYSSTQPATEAHAVIAKIRETAARLNLKHPMAVWPEALPEKIYLPDVLNDYLTGGWDGQDWRLCKKWGDETTTRDFVYPYLGMKDLPSKQKQLPLQADTAQGGNMLIFGSSATGKSTMMRTLAVSLALTNSPSEVNLYILDYGGQASLKILEAFPHVGAIATRIESERTERLIQLIRTEILIRNEKLRNTNVDNWIDYNAIVPDALKLPALYLLIDSFGNLRQSFEIEFIDQVSSLLNGGQSAGLFMIISSSLQSDVPNDLFANINFRLTFLQADSTEYFRIVGHPSDSKLEEDAIKGIRPGRGMLRGTQPIEFQAALPAYGANDRDQIAAISELGMAMNRVWTERGGRRPAQVLTLPLFVQRPMFRGGGRPDCLVELGVDFERLDPIGLSLVNDGPAFLIGSSARQSGRTTLMLSWALGLAERYSPDRLKLVLIDFHTRSLVGLRRLPHVDYIGSRQAFDTAIEALLEETSRREAMIADAYDADPDSFNPAAILLELPQVVLMIDDYDSFFRKTDGEQQSMVDLIRRSAELGFSFIISCKMGDLPANYIDHFAEQFRKRGTGILFGGTEGIDEFNNTRPPTGMQSAGLPRGRGFIVQRGRACLFQAYTYWDKDQSAPDVLQKRVEAIESRIK